MNGIQEVSGSIPLISTKTQKSEPVCCWQWVRIFRISARIGIGPGEGRTAAVSLRCRRFSIYRTARRKERTGHPEQRRSGRNLLKGIRGGVGCADPFRIGLPSLRSGPLASAGLRPREHGKFKPGGKPPGPCTGYAEQISNPTSAICDHQGCAAFPFVDFSLTFKRSFKKQKNPQAKPAAGVKLSLTAKGLAGYPAPFLLIFPGAWYKMIVGNAYKRQGIAGCRPLHPCDECPYHSAQQSK